MCFSETKTDDLDKIELEGYEFKMKNRGKFLKRKSGGLVFGYKKELASNIKTLCTESKFGFWFKVSGDIFNLDKDVIFGIVYVPPENTRYTSSTDFTEIEADCLVLSRNYNYISLLGDFYGLTSNNDDFIHLDKNRHGMILLIFINDDLVTLDELEIPRKRKSMDKVRNGWNKLLELCRGNSLYLLNGRVGEDQHEGRITCKNSSTVDYCLLYKLLIILKFLISAVYIQMFTLQYKSTF